MIQTSSLNCDRGWASGPNEALALRVLLRAQGPVYRYYGCDSHLPHDARSRYVTRLSADISFVIPFYGHAVLRTITI